MKTKNAIEDLKLIYSGDFYLITGFACLQLFGWQPITRPGSGPRLWTGDFQPSTGKYL